MTAGVRHPSAFVRLRASRWCLTDHGLHGENRTVTQVNSITTGVAQTPSSVLTRNVSLESEVDSKQILLQMNSAGARGLARASTMSH